MNILIPHHWLLDHLATQASPEQIAEYLSLAGPSVEKIEQIEQQPVYDIEVTSNRVDLMSVRGMAREASVILPEFDLPAKLKPFQPVFEIAHDLPELGIEIVNQPELCERILAVKISRVKISDSPEWLQQRLRQVGQRPLNNVIDITNYVMWELGQPIHAFDYDKLSAGQIIVRQAKPGEQLITLDGKTHTLRGGEVVFDNGQGEIIDLPGIMGTQNSVVDANTTTVLLWIEHVKARLIRQASMGLNIRTQAAILNEKNVDPDSAPVALARAGELMLKLTGGQASSQIVDIYPQPRKITSTRLQHQLLEKYLGVEIPSQQVTRILTKLGCQVKQEQGSYLITPPSYRAADLQLPVDYIEEITRIYGYHNLPDLMLDGSIPDQPFPVRFELEEQIKYYLSDWGGQEVYTYSLVSADLAQAAGYSLAEHLKLKNPLTQDNQYLRRSLLPSLAQVNQQVAQHQHWFELAAVYLPQASDLPDQPWHLAWLSDSDLETFLGSLTALFHRLHLSHQVTPQTDQAHLPFAAHVGAIQAAGTTVGYLGQMPDQSWGWEIDLDKLLPLVPEFPPYQPAPTYPPVIQDLKFEFGQPTYLGPVIQAIKQVDPLIRRVELLDRYHQSVTFRIYFQSFSGNLSDDKIQPIRQKIIQLLQQQFSVQFNN